jgi:1-acyl-sn-glycerol-3-phosphate acyltransferase
MFAYRILQTFLRLVVRVFFRQIVVVGEEHVPGEGESVIFAGNHPNSLLDPVVIIATGGRIVHFAAKDVLFRSAVLRPFLRQLGAVPIARRSDHGGGAVDNADAFAALFDVLAKGRAVGIFPEGLSHDDSQLARMKTGAARVAFGACERHAGLRVRIVPCGLNYVHPKRFRSRVLVQFGPAIDVGPDDLAAYAADPRGSVVALTERIDAALRALTVNADSWETLRVLDGVRRLYQPRDVSLAERVELARRFATVYPTVRDEPEVRAIYARVDDFLLRLECVGLRDRDLRDGVSPFDALLRFLRHVVLLGFWLPLALPGAFVHLPMATFVRLTSRRLSPRKDVVATTKLMIGLVGIVLAYGALIALSGWRGGWRSALVTAVLLPLSGQAALQVLERAAGVKRLGSTLARLLFLRREIATLRTLREQLEADVIRAVERFRPADMAPLVVRDSGSAGAA